MKYADICLPIPQNLTFTYSVPTKFLSSAQIGQRVVVPFRERITSGFIVNLKDKCDLKYTKDVITLIDKNPLLSPTMLELARWISQYYISSLGQTLQFFVPHSIRRKIKRKTIDFYYIADKKLAEELLLKLPKNKHRQKLLIKILLNSKDAVDFKQLKRLCAVNRASLDALIDDGIIKVERKSRIEELHKVFRKVDDFKLTEEQESAVEKALQSRKLVSLLFGVTGSGKTEVYARIAKRVAGSGKRSIVLVPEIGLTPQLVSYFENRFPGKVSVLHSYLTPLEKSLEWERIVSGKVDVVIGTRSAIFAPVKDLGFIAIDEEQDASYKEHSNPQYNAIQVAIKRAELEGAKVMLGSATPSVESFYLAQKGEYELITLSKKVYTVQEPLISVIDMKQERFKRGRFTILSSYLQERIKDVIEQKKQALIFVNRRGYSTILFCYRCKFGYSCKSCDTPLTFHKDLNSFLCHYCLKEYESIKACPRCGYQKLTSLGVGTEKVFEEVKRIVNCEAARMDSDTMKSRRDYISLLQNLYDGKVDMLVGTQMACKGLDVEKIVLVGIVYAEANLTLPDFRTIEKTFQLIHQAAGRAGRRNERAEVIIQTAMPNHFVIEFARSNNYLKFYEVEIKHRHDFLYPPFSRLVRILSEDKNESLAVQRIEKAKESLSKINGVEVLGPGKPFFKKLQGRYRYHVLVKVKSDADDLQKALRRITEEQHFKLRVDVDPVSLL
ncbi:MAG: primosomal protein N' [Planctomycetes bacterium]|nr:primosomal protein N' [Planctomycetota bacterium]